MDYYIGLTGLDVAQKAIDIIGTNIANSATEGYHRQRPDITPMTLQSLGKIALGGSQISNVKRCIDILLEQEMARQQPILGQTEQELEALKAIESALGDIESGGLAGALNNMFTAFNDLTSEPHSDALRQQVVWGASSVAENLRHLGDYITELERHVKLQLNTHVAHLNELTREVADLNEEIHNINVRDGNANLLEDRRDQALKEIAELIDIQTQELEGSMGAINVFSGGTPLVVSFSNTELEVGTADMVNLGLSVKEASYFIESWNGGRIEGLLNLHNNIVSDISGNLDTLAQSLMFQINKIHSQGLGSDGSFTELVGAEVETDKTLSEISDLVQAGSFYVRLTDTTASPPTFSRHAVAIDPATDMLPDVVAAINAGVPNVTASIVNSSLSIVADAGFEFDFTPALLPEPTTSTLTGTSDPTVSGFFEHDENETFTATIQGTGDVGVDADLRVEVENAAGEVVRTLDIGLGYAAGDPLEVLNGVYLSFSAGSVNNGETFTVQALVDADPTGALGMLGMNAMFEGTTASNIQVADRLKNDPGQLGTSISSHGDDNYNALQLAAVAETGYDELNGWSPNDFWGLLVTDVGQRIELGTVRVESIENIQKQLENQRDDISGVDVNEEAARMVIFEQMFHAMAKLVATQEEAMDALMQLL